MKLHKTLPLLFLIGASFLTSCQGSQKTPDLQIHQINDPFMMLKHLQEISNPFSMFEQVYPSFSFHSHAVLEERNASGKAYSSLSSTNVYEQIENKYYHILRKPLPPVPSVEIIYDKGLIFLRPHLEKTFYQIKNNPELIDLKKSILTEVFYFLDIEALKKAPKKLNNQKECYQALNQEICFDPNTKLPVSGKASTEQAQGGFMTLTFDISVEKQEIEMIKAEKIHSLRNHSNF